MIAVVDYGMGNLHSVRNAINAVGAEVLVTSHPEDLEQADRIVLPGVGAFGECVKNLRASGLVEALEQQVLRRGKPFFGICLGMQVLARQGYEMGAHAGLGWLPAIVRRLAAADHGLKVPHVGWNEVRPAGNSPLFRGFRSEPTFYFVHSYCLQPDQESLTAATCTYGEPFTAAVMVGNLFATQFHPEKSQRNGLRLLKNFLLWKP